MTGDGAERGLAEAVVAAMRAPARSVAGRLPLGGLTGLLARCAVVVSNDSGPLHLAAAVGARTAGIFWCGNLINGGPVSRTEHRPAVSWRLDCPRCGAHCLRERCPHPDSFVTDVPVDEVRSAALALLAAARPARVGAVTTEEGR